MSLGEANRARINEKEDDRARSKRSSESGPSVSINRVRGRDAAGGTGIRLRL
jgi:hypothetical protein